MTIVVDRDIKLISITSQLKYSMCDKKDGLDNSVREQEKRNIGLEKKSNYFNHCLRAFFLLYADWFTYFDTHLIRHLTRLQLCQNTQTITLLKAVLLSIKPTLGYLFPSR